MVEYREDHDLDVKQVARLRESAGWAPLAPEVLRAQFQGSRWVVSAWLGPRLVGCVRAISDGVTNAYICGMVVDAEYRGRGIGRELLRRLVTGRNGIRWVLHSRPEVIGFYEKLDFLPTDNMLRRDRR